MTKQELTEAVAALKDPGQPLSHALALRIADALEALSPPTPEDVAADFNEVDEALRLEAGYTGDAPGTVRGRLARLRDGAARVPGLEAELERLNADFAKEEQQRTATEAKWHECAEAATRAESERDAARKEVARLRTSRDEWKATAMKEAEEAQSHRARVATLEAAVEATRDSCKGFETKAREGADAVIRAEAAERARHEADAAAAQINELHDAEVKRRQAAERRVAELEAENGTLKMNNAGIAKEWKEKEAERAKAVATVRLAHAQREDVWFWEGDPKQVATLHDDHPVVMSSATLRGILATSPAPAGLLEAVGPLAEYVRHALEMRGKEAPRPFPAKEARTFLAAYDAAKGGEPTHTSCNPDNCGDDATATCPQAPATPLTPESIRDMGHAIRARIAPTPTPEGPAMSDGERVMWSIVAPDAQPVPAAPVVVWEAAGSVRIVGPVGEEHAEVKGKDGEWYECNVGGWAYVLARALAEAKREANTNRDLWDALNERMGDVEASIRKAAEDMRERAAKVIENRLAYIAPEDDRYVFCRKLLRDIDTLPVEAP